MKTQITKTLTRSTGNYRLNGQMGLCDSFVQAFFPKKPLPNKIKVSVSIRSWAFKDAKRIWIRHQYLGNIDPSSWTWEKDGTVPANFEQGGGMYSAAAEQVQNLLGEKLLLLPKDFRASSVGVSIPVYVRIVKA